jgi:hypothetical protein
MDEKRKFHRIPFQCQSQVRCGDKTYAAELLDISMKGALMLVRDMPEWKMEHLCFLDIKLVSSDIHLQFEAKLSHQEESHYGFVFLSEEIDTFAHLRRLLELNLGDSEIIDRELGDWMKG